MMQVSTWIKGLEVLVEYNRNRPMDTDDDRRQQQQNASIAAAALARASRIRDSTTHSAMTTSASTSSNGESTSVAATVPAEQQPVTKKGSKGLLVFGATHNRRSQPVATSIQKQYSVMNIWKSKSRALGLHPTTDGPDSDSDDEDSASSSADPKCRLRATSNGSSSVTNGILRNSGSFATGEDRKLFEFVVVVRIDDSSANGKKNAVISYNYPPSCIDKKENKRVLDSLPLFCFPDVELLKKVNSVQR